MSQYLLNEWMKALALDHPVLESQGQILHWE